MACLGKHLPVVFRGLQPNVQALKYMQNLAGGAAEVVFGGDLNWLEEEQGALPLPPGW